MKPVYKIETYTGDTLDYTITDQALSVYFKEVVTENIGTFNFILPTVKGTPNPYYYGDIALNGKVKIWVGYDTYTTNPQFVGKILNISAPLSTQEGYVRVISGMSLGEVLKRRQKTKFYTGISASSVVAEWADDLGLGTEQIDAGGPLVTLEFCNEPYWNCLQEVSDYWVDAATQIKKDFYVAPCTTHANGDLVWKSRPFRTSGVETLTVGDNILNYNVNRDLLTVKNRMKIYGARGINNPSDKDEWTETSISGWNLVCDGGTHIGSISSDYTRYKVNTRSIKGTTVECWTHNYWVLKKTLPSAITLYDPDYTTLNFWIYANTTIPAFHVRLYANNASNYLRIDPDRRLWGEWKEFNLPLAEAYPVGSPDKSNVTDIMFYLGVIGGVYEVNVDGLYFSGKRYSTVEEDSTSQSNYGIRECMQTDNNLLSNSDCQKRGQALLYQGKDVPIRLDVTVCPGSNNLLVGDRIPMTIPVEGISVQNYDVIAVEQSVNAQSEFASKVTMINSANRRMVQPVTQQEVLKRELLNLNQAAKWFVMT